MTTSRAWISGVLALVTALAAPSAVSPVRPLGPRPAAAPGNAALRAYGARGVASTAAAHSLATEAAAKLDGALADIGRHLALVRAGSELADLHALHPAARFRRSAAGTPEVLVDAVTRGDANTLQSALLALGLEHPSLYANDVSGWLPVAEIGATAERTEVIELRAALPHRRAAVATQGDFVQGSAAVRTTNPMLTGAGVTVGVLSDSFNCFAVYAAPGSGVPEMGPTGYSFSPFAPTTAAQDEASGALPSTVNVIEEVGGGGSSGCDAYGAPTLTPFTDEGRAMMQIVHVVAPAASLAFYTADNGESEFANGIEALEAAGAKVILDDAGYYDEPVFQDGIVAQAVDTVEAEGVAYFSAAGNDASFAYENTAPSFATLSSSAPNSGEHLLNFDTSGHTTTTSLPVTIPSLVPGEFVAVVLQWDQPYVTGAPQSGGATGEFDLCIEGVSGNDLVTNPESQDFPNAVTCTGHNALGNDPYQVLIIGNPATNANNSSSQTMNVVVGLAGGTAPGRVRVAILGDGASVSINQFATMSPTIQGHPLAAGAAAVAAAFYFDTPSCGTTPASLESFSSLGGDPILFDVNGNRLATPVVRQKPNFVAPDGVNTTFLGYSLTQFGYQSDTLQTNIPQCQNDSTYPNFFGTSAATPHAGGIAALMFQANPALTPAQIYGALQASALPMAGATPNYSSGYGFIQANAAVVTPSISLNATTIVVGSSTTLSWSAPIATSCTASGNWSGAQNPSGNLVVMPATAGTYTYTLTCSDTTGSSPPSSATLTVTPAPPAAPTLSLGASSVVAGSSTTLMWSSTNATSCTASGSWSGAQSTSGNLTVTPASAGNYTYTLSCSDAGGSSPQSSVTLTATAPASHHGGALDLTTLLGLAGLLGLSVRRRISAGTSP